MKLTKLLSSALVLSFFSISAQATLIQGSDFISNPFVSLPNGNGVTSGTSQQFLSFPASGSVFVDLDLFALGFGTASGKATSGSVVVKSTRLSSDSDLIIGLWDGTTYDAFALWDGNRTNNVLGSTSNGTTFNYNTGTTVGTPNTQGVGEVVTQTFTFDLISEIVSLSTLGLNRSGSLSAAFNASSTLRFLIAVDTSNEDHQIDSIDINGAKTSEVPEPATLGLLGLACLAMRRFKRS